MTHAPRKPNLSPTRLSSRAAVIFSPSSRGQLALVIFEWNDASHLGVDQNGQSTENEWSDEVSSLNVGAERASHCPAGAILAGAFRGARLHRTEWS